MGTAHGTGNCDCGCGGSGSRGGVNPQSLLHELFDPETSAARAAEIRALIAECPECFARFESEKAVRGLVKDCCGQAKAPEPLRQRIITQITSVRVTEIRRYR